MAKAILVITINYTDSENIGKIIEAVKNRTENEYHVICKFEKIDVPKIEVFNDCKGLKDVDIEKLIKELNGHS